ncbi:N-acetylglucosamine-6-phosphate deacetylase [Celerinatantimonas sp. YJH-8]|uniref:N-acetylglucosamine-6-phosphate deacetylase n=1 Tax=Celerinatantimonas sp. YJH-8 TaxID=3228714 RepID=UPI0038C07832
MKYALTSATIFDGEQLRFGQAVIIDGDRIESIISEQDLTAEIPQYALKHHLIAPAFIDLQVNGCGGVMFNDKVTEKTLDTMHQANLKSGTTTFLPTLITCGEDKLDAALELAQNYRLQHGFRVPGIHLEGPFISREKKGIHNEHYIRPLQNQDVEKLIAHKDQIGMLTLAPENATPEQISQLSDAGIPVSLGHSNADCQTVQQAFHAGAKYATHLYNAMSGYKGREPGMIGAVFDTPAVHAGIIADGLHLDFVNLRIAKRLLDQRLYLITDATAAAGSDITEFDFVGQKIRVENGKCLGRDGTIGGSMLTMVEAVKNCIAHAGISQEEALRMASLYPAQAMGWAHKLGRIQPNYLANLVILSSDYQVAAVVDQGKWNSFTHAESNR